MRGWVRALEGEGRQTARREYANYLSDMSKFLRVRNIKRQPIADHGAVFERFLDTREHLLGDPARRSKAARVMVLAPMPDIWGDSEQATNFEDSFFSDVSDRAMTVRFGGRVGRVIRSIMKGVVDPDLSVPDELRNALEKRLAERPWADAEWLGRRG